MIDKEPAFNRLLGNYCCENSETAVSKAKEVGLTVVNEGLFAISSNPVVVRQECPLVVGITGLSGSGKDTISNELVISGRYELVKNHTTRERRRRDVGSPYIYISIEEFEDKIEKGDFIEYFLRGTEYMGMEKKAVDNVLEHGKTPIIRTGPQAIGKLQNLLPDIFVVSFFVIPQGWRDLQKRLVARDIINCAPRPKSEAREDVRFRLERNKKLLEYIPEANYLLVNRDGAIKEAINNIQTVLSNIKKIG